MNKYVKRSFIQISSNFRSHLPCSLSKLPLRREFLDIYLTTFFAKRDFGKTSAMRGIFFWKCGKFYLHFKNAAENSEKAFCFLDNCIWIGCLNLSLLRRETCDRQSMCSQTVRRFSILLRETFSNSITFIVINRYANGAVAQI